MKKIVVAIIHYDTPGYLKTCMDAILKQSYENFEVFFIDNDSPSKEGLEYMRKHYDEERVHIVANEHNSGYSGAANQGVELAKGAKADYLVITNPDIIFEADYFEKALEIMEARTDLAALTGKIKKYDFKNKKETNNIDTVGLFSFKNRRIIDDGQGLPDDGRFDEEKEVFGVSGACPFYRMAALEDVKVNGEYLDDDFFMYKEDVDVSWRFILFGWKCLYSPSLVAWHGRGTGVLKRFTHWSVMKNRSKLSKFQKYYSFRNQRLMQVKNELWGTIFRHPFGLIFKEFLVFFYVLFREPSLIKGYFSFWYHFPNALRKRREIMKRKKVSAKEMEKWFGQNQSEYY